MTRNNSPIYIETQHAWYILRMPTEKYKRWYQRFHTPRRIAQMIICNAMKRSHLKFESFIRGVLASSTDIFGEKYDEGDLWSAVGPNIHVFFFGGAQWTIFQG
jgi:DNA (cytosine-5)-methyltransferase 1